MSSLSTLLVPPLHSATLEVLLQDGPSVQVQDSLALLARNDGRPLSSSSTAAAQLTMRQAASRPREGEREVY